MKTITQLWCAMFVVSLVGCASNDDSIKTANLGGGDQAIRYGSTSRAKANDKSVIAQKVEGIEISPGMVFRPRTKDDVYVIGHVDSMHAWTAAIGSGPDADPNNPAINELFQAVYHVRPDPAMEVMWGWVWATGNRPRVKTRRVRAWVDGISIMGQDLETPGPLGGTNKVVERIVFIAGSITDEVRVTFDGDPTSKEYRLKNVGDYFELINGETVRMGKMSDRPDIQKVVAEASNFLYSNGLR